MPRILSIDYGTKKTGIAVTDPLQIIVNGLDTVLTKDLEDFLLRYTKEEEVEEIIIGYPTHPDGNPAQLASQIDTLAERLKKKFPDIKILLHDERYTSKEAKRIISKSGLPQKKRRNKALVDKISAVLILQDYLSHI